MAIIAGSHPPTCCSRSRPRRPGVVLVHYDRDYERIAAVGGLRHEWLVPDGTLA
jgi:hypothetical protein